MIVGFCFSIVDVFLAAEDEDVLANDSKLFREGAEERELERELILSIARRMSLSTSITDPYVVFGVLENLSVSIENVLRSSRKTVRKKQPPFRQSGGGYVLRDLTTLMNKIGL